MARIQGEGDYEAARRYRKRAEASVRSAHGRAVTRAVKAADTPRGLTDAEKKVRKRAKAGDQDARDATVMRKRVGTARSRSR